MLTDFLVRKKIPLTSSLGSTSIRSMEGSVEINATLTPIFHLSPSSIAYSTSIICLLLTSTVHNSLFSVITLKDPEALFKFPPYQHIWKQRDLCILLSFLLSMDAISPTFISGRPSACSLGAHNFHSLSCILSFPSSLLNHSFQHSNT